MQVKTPFLYLLVAVLLLCVFLPQVVANRRPATRNRPRRQECKDDRRVHSTCVKLRKELGLQVCHVEIDQLKAKMARSCAATCNLCGRPQRNCRTSIYGCCWDAHTPRGDIYGLTGCPQCKDHLNLCSRFRKFCFHKKSENRSFIELHCPLTCGKCKKRRNARIKDSTIKMTDWFRVWLYFYTSTRVRKKIASGDLLIHHCWRSRLLIHKEN